MPALAAIADIAIADNASGVDIAGKLTSRLTIAPAPRSVAAMSSRMLSLCEMKAIPSLGTTITARLQSVLSGHSGFIGALGIQGTVRTLLQIPAGLTGLYPLAARLSVQLFGQGVTALLSPLRGSAWFRLFGRAGTRTIETDDEYIAQLDPCLTYIAQLPDVIYTARTEGDTVYTVAIPEDEQ